MGIIAMANAPADGELDIAVRAMIAGGSVGLMMLPPSWFSPVATFGIVGLTALKRRQKIANLMMIGDVIRTVISEKRCRIKRFKDAYSVDLFQACQQDQLLALGFEFSVKEGDYIQKALFSVTGLKINEYNTNGRPVTGVYPPDGLEAIDFDFAGASVDYGKELDAMFLYRVNEQKQKILKTLGAIK